MAHVDELTEGLDILDLQFDTAENPVLNELILLNIFSNLAFPTLKKARLVCKTWNRVATPIVGLRGQMLFRNIFYNKDQVKQTSTPEITQALVNRLNLSIYIPSWCELADRNLTSYFQKYQNQLSHIEFSHDTLILNRGHLDKTGIEALFYCLKEFILPGLSCLKISFMGSLSNSFTLPNFSAPLNLTELQIGFEPVDDAPLHESFQRLINSAPKLQTFILNSFHYFDLSQCKFLKEFVYMHDMGSVLIQEIPRLYQMLDDTKATLIKVVLQFPRNVWCTGMDVFMSSLDIPRMPEVVELQFTDQFAPWRWLEPHLFPKLKTISLFGISFFDKYKSFLHKELDTVTSLRIGGVNATVDQFATFLHILKVRMPNLQKLDCGGIQIFDGNARMLVGDHESAHLFGRVVHICEEWQLQRLVWLLIPQRGKNENLYYFPMRWAYVLAHLMHLTNCSGGIKEVVLYTPPNNSLISDHDAEVPDRLMDLLKSCGKTRLVFQNVFRVRNKYYFIEMHYASNCPKCPASIFVPWASCICSDWNRICKFIEGHGLPVKFQSDRPTRHNDPINPEVFEYNY